VNIDQHWKRYEPSSANPWTLAKAGHLLRRTGFGPTTSELQQALNDGPQPTLDRLFSEAKHSTDAAQASEYAARERSLPRDAGGTQLAAWWLHRILNGSKPLHEKICLFWHDHFATSIVKVQQARFMLGHYRLLSELALGDFRKLVNGMSFDPAMMIWLDTVESRKGKPNENYARELMELFTLGIGNYTEADIREAARAFTGYELLNNRIVFSPRKHDDGDKTVFGSTGNWNGDDIVRLCLAKPACAEFIVRKLYRFFFSDLAAPTDDRVRTAAALYREANYDATTLLQAMLRSEHFFSPTVYRRKVKSPIEFAVGIVRGLEGNIGALPLAQRLENLGQQLFAPPSVKGWDGGRSWLNAQTLLLRGNLASALTSTRDSAFTDRCDPVKFLKGDVNPVDSLTKLFLQDDLPESAKDKLAAYADAHPKGDGIRSLTHLICSLPEFQLA